MTIAQLVAAIEGLGLSLGPHGNKVVADAARWEISRGHIRRAGRGVLAAGRVPPSTAFYMRRRLRLYLLDPSQGYSRPSNLPYLPNPPYGPGGPSTPPNE